MAEQGRTHTKINDGNRNADGQGGVTVLMQTLKAFPWFTKSTLGARDCLVRDSTSLTREESGVGSCFYPFFAPCSFNFPSGKGEELFHDLSLG